MSTLAQDIAYQEAVLQDVSRTFALTIPRLPEGLRTVTGNAYLLCRIADTIEDSEALTLPEKRRFYDAFLSVLDDGTGAAAFGRDLAPRLTGSTLPAERALIENTGRVVHVTGSFPEADQAALSRCVRVMSEGMEQFQEGQFAHGLRDMAHMDAYCYYVAGVVGEMMTELFCNHSEPAARNGEALRALAVSFGQGLQMTNILKDIWDDRERGMCWLPRSVFARHGFDLTGLAPDNHGPAFQAGLLELVGVARAHLENALTYTLHVPPSEKGIRIFCLWALGMAVLTLRKLNQRPDFTGGGQVKISRRSVFATLAAARAFGGSDWILKRLFAVAAAPLPRAGSVVRSELAQASRQ